jgi:hypothetical protein
MTAAPLHIAVPEGTAPYWLSLLQRSGLPTRTLGSVDHTAATLFLPEGAGLDSRALRRTVARLRFGGTPVLAGPAWGEALDVHLPPGTEVGLGNAAEGVRRIDPSPLLVLPLPGAERLLRASASLTTLQGPDGLAAGEVIATADHGGLRRCIESSLRSLAFAAGRPFARLAHAPLGFDGTFAFRVDADDYRAAATATLLASLSRAGLRSTWFLDVERHLSGDGLRDTVQRLRAGGHEVQTHFFRHYTYRSTARNQRNLQRSLDELRALGVAPNAAAAPFGSWNAGLDAALRACGMQWSSEFSRVHDDVPGALAGATDEPWQVPIHPVCPALLFAAGADVGAVSRWFLAELRECLQRGEPAVFYGHPIADLERCPDLLPELATTARSSVRSLWQPTLGELHTFARQRAAQSLCIDLVDGRIEGDTDGPAPLVLERADLPPATVAGAFSLPQGEPTPFTHDHGPILVPAPYRARTAHRDRLRTHRLQFARLLREIRR